MLLVVVDGGVKPTTGGGEGRNLSGHHRVGAGQRGSTPTAIDTTRGGVGVGGGGAYAGAPSYLVFIVRPIVKVVVTVIVVIALVVKRREMKRREIRGREIRRREIRGREIRGREIRRREIRRREIRA